MPRTTVVNGLVWSVPIASASINPVIDGQNNDGSIPLILNQNLSDSPGHIKSDFYGFFRRIQLSIDSGLAVSHNGGSVRLDTGAIATFAAGKVFLPASSAGFIWVQQTSASAASIAFGSSLPSKGFVLAAYATSSTDVTLLSDLRDKAIDAIAPIFVAESASPWDPGDVIIRASGVAKPGQWLWCDGAQYATAAYPNLFAAIGYTYGGSGANFRVPDYRGRSPVCVGGSDGIAMGQLLGSPRSTLNINQIPLHSHGVAQAPHTHTNPGHSHGVVVNDPGHFHTIGSYRAAALNALSSDGVGAEASTQGQGGQLRADRTDSNISATIGSASVDIQGALVPITILPEGGTQPIETRSPSIGCQFMIRY